MKPLIFTYAAGINGARSVESFRQHGPDGVISVDAVAHFKERAEHKGIDFGTIVDRDDLFDWLEREKPGLSGIIHLGAITDTTMMDVALLKKRNVDYSQQIWNYASSRKCPQL